MMAMGDDDDDDVGDGDSATGDEVDDDGYNDYGDERQGRRWRWRDERRHDGIRRR